MSPLDYLHRYIRVAEVIAILLACAGIAYGVHRFLEHERQIGRDEVQARWDAQTAKDKAEKARKDAETAKQQQEANSHAIEREQGIRVAADAANAASLGLRDAIAEFSRRVPSNPSGSNPEPAATLGKLLADCEGRYRGLAENADRHVSDLQKLTEAWPHGDEKAPR